MAVESDADRLSFTVDFGVTVTWSVGATVFGPFLAVFDNGAVDQPVGDGADARNREASITFPESLLPPGSDAGEDSVSIAGVAYEVKDVLPDGTGMVTVRLEQVL